MSDSRASKPIGYIPPIDGLRAIAVFAVCYFTWALNGFQVAS